MRKKGTKTQIAERVLQVKKFILEGKHHTEIVQYGSEKWNLTDRQCRKYIRKARADIDESFKQRLDTDLAWHIDARKNLLAYATHISDIRLAHQIVRDLAELGGLYVTKVEHIDPVKQRLLSVLTDDQIRKMAEVYLDRNSIAD